METEAPRVVLMCHEHERVDAEGLASWLTHSMNLSGIILLREPPGALGSRARREIRRVGPLRFLDVIAWRIYRRLLLARSDAAWVEREVARLRARYPADLNAPARLLVTDPNTPMVSSFLRQQRPDLMVARVKCLLGPGIFNIPRLGTYVLHPGISPEYRNAHGCFWALVRRDLGRVGMTLLRIDAGIDTGPVFLQCSCDFDEKRESPAIIQYRVVLDNLDIIGRTLINIWRGQARTVDVAGRHSAAWGQPWLSAYWRWKWAARRDSP